MKVMVFQFPCGALAIRRSPLGPHPRKGAMFVLTHVSSMKTRRAALILPCYFFQRSRLRTMSGAFSSLAWIVFFEAQPFGLQKPPDGAPVRFDAARGELGHKLSCGQ